MKESTKTPPNEGEHDIVAQQAMLQTVFTDLKEQLQAREDADPDRGKRKAAALEKIDLEQLALHIMIRAAEHGTTLASEVQLEVDAIEARKKLREDQGEGPSHQWGSIPLSPVSQDTQQDPLQEAFNLIQFPSPSDPISPMSISGYTSFSSKAPSSTFFPPFSRVPT